MTAIYKKVNTTTTAEATNQLTKIENCIATIQLVEDTKNNNYYKFDLKIITVYYKNKSTKVLTIYTKIPLLNNKI